MYDEKERYTTFMKWGKIILVIFGALIVTALGIDASDTLSGSRSTLLSQVISKGEGKCPSGMNSVENISTVSCVDTYEASPSPLCLHTVLNSAVETEQNANTKGCIASSVKGVAPWTYVSLSQAQRLCVAAGKRLPTNEEWYRIALGTNADTCTIHSNGVLNTGNETCVSTAGAHDMVGNVWEWVDESVVGNTLYGRELPQEGYVTSVDANGVAISSSENGDELSGNDYFWSKEEGIFGIIRGGFYGSNKDAGLYTANASVLTSFASQGVGFRCVKDM